jgi:uncharacterized SAM-binding protein YcdF (DUF218 family)
LNALSRGMTGVAGALALAWAGGFLWFSWDILRPAPAQEAGALGKADGIVVLTGGAERVSTGMRLLQGGCCGRMLISGVGHGAELAALLRGTGVPPDPIGDHITLGRAATSTAGNADETAAWAHANHLHSLIVVTAYYHMPRALFELGRTAPDLRLIPAPVQPANADRGGPLAQLSRLATEYTKFLGSAVGLTLFEHARETERRGPEPRGRA